MTTPAESRHPFSVELSRYVRLLTLTLMSLAAAVGCASTPDTSDTPDTTAGGAQLFDNMGSHRRTITTDSAEAQAYFDQGLTWMYAFNHDEAIRSFTRAGELDPDCAMAFWGVAMCQGPNYNDPSMSEARSEAAWDALQKAMDRIDHATEVERALIEALAHRYANPWPEDRTDLEQSYADAMAEVWAAHRNDSDIGTLYAESMMVQMPWKLYTLDFEPAPDTSTIVAALERVMEMNPDHPGANHLYIHAVEPSDDPDRGLAAADRLGELVPGAGHLDHMPSHIYVKTGRWKQAIIRNQKAMRADASYRTLSPNQGIQWVYMVHNSHMLAYAAMMSGRERDAMAAARAMWEDVPDEAMRAVGPFFDFWMCSVYDVQKRFGRWDDILAEPAPPSYLPVTTAMWRAARAVAYAAKKDFANAEREHEAFREARAQVPDDSAWGEDLAQKVLQIGDYFIAGEIALQQDDLETAAFHLTKAAAAEDLLSYGEPPQWLQPVRHTLGAVYLKAGRHQDAERVYREDLAKWRNNGWSLYGLSRALDEQGKIAEAREIEAQYLRAWDLADALTTTSCKCIPEM